MARILVVDDQVEILKMLETLLSQKGHVVTTSKDAFDALDKASNRPYEMIITDAVMPGGPSGFDLVKTIRDTPKLAGLPVVLLTGRREKKDVHRGIDAGADDYIVKPVDPDLLLAKVDALLKKTKSEAAFAECLTSHEAQFTPEIKIVSVSEIGMTLHSSQPMRPTSKITMKSAFFEEIEMERPMLRVVSCEPKGESEFIVKLQFMGITESDMKPLRLWMRNQAVRRAS